MHVPLSYPFFVGGSGTFVEYIVIITAANKFGPGASLITNGASRFMPTLRL